MPATDVTGADGRRLESLWQALAAAADADLPLLEGAFLIARDEYPELAVPAYLERLDAVTADARAALAAAADAAGRVRALNRVLFDDCGFRGDVESYYDPRNSYLNDVIDRRLGIPITLSVIYVEVARRAGLEAHGIGFPGHFLVRIGAPAEAVIVDPFNAGARLEPARLKRELAAVKASGGGARAGLDPLAPVTNRAILVRMLRNLKAIYLGRKDAERALRSSDRIVTLLPNHAAEYRDRALLYQELEVPHAALGDFRRYLELAPRATDAAAVRARIDELEGETPPLH